MNTDFGLNMQRRFPDARNTLTCEDVERLDALFSILNRAARYTPLFDRTSEEISEILGMDVA